MNVESMVEKFKDGAKVCLGKCSPVKAYFVCKEVNKYLVRNNYSWTVEANKTFCDMWSISRND